MQQSLKKTCIGLAVAVTLGPIACIGGTSDIGNFGRNQIEVPLDNESLERAQNPRQQVEAFKPDKMNIKIAQKELNNNGFSLEVDGVQGPQTRRALRVFQEEQGLKTTGSINPETMAALELDIYPDERSPASIEEELQDELRDPKSKTYPEKTRF